jgi:hypothetical protein
MTPPIGEQFADPNCSGDYLVPALRLIAFGIYLVITPEAEPSADALEGDQRIERPDLATLGRSYACAANPPR